MKKMLILLFLSLAFFGCSDDNTSKQKVLVDVNLFYDLTLDQAREEYGELVNYGPFTYDGIDTNIYTSEDKGYEFYFSPDGQKLHALYIYGKENEFTVIRETKIAESLGLEHGPNAAKNKGGAPRYYNVDKTGFVKEVYFMHSGAAEFPMTVDLIQIWFN